MCCEGKCLYCLEVETGSLIFAIINLIITSVAALLTLGITVYINIILAVGVSEFESRGNMRSINIFFALGMPLNILLGVILVFILLALTFAILLTKGLVANNAGYVKAYFIFGIVQNVVALIIAAVLIATCAPVAPIIINLLACFIYSMILVMIHMTYKKLLKGSVLQHGSHRRLIETSSQ